MISVKLRNPQFEGQTKTKLGNPGVEGLVKTTVNQKLAEFLEENPTDARQIITKAVVGRTRAPGRAEGARADASQERARVELAPRASSPTARSTTPSRPSSSSSRARRPAARPSTRATARSRRSFRCAARSSTRRRTASTRSSRTRRSSRSITAIGAGIGDEFDVSKLRYHRVIVMTDADVDGAHIRTLILTFLYRQMPELVERGHVYIAVAPLYRVKIGNQLRYVEKESQLEELLVRERVKDMDVTDRSGETQKLTEARYGRFAKVLHEFDGWASRLREDFGAAAANFVIDHRIVETELPRRPRDALGELEPNGYELSVLVVGRGRRRCCGSSSGRPAPRRASSCRPSCSRRRSTRTSGRRTRASRSSSATRRSRSPSARRRASAETFGHLRGLRARAGEGGHPGQPLQGSRRDGRRGARGHDHEPCEPHARPRRGRGRGGCRPASSRRSWATRSSRAALFIEQNAREVRFLDV